jgi:glycine/D-amino acid oxidase-like deaminating enzyme
VPPALATFGESVAKLIIANWSFQVKIECRSLPLRTRALRLMRENRERNEKPAEMRRAEMHA